MAKRILDDEEIREVLGKDADNVDMFSAVREVSDKGIHWYPNMIGLKAVVLILRQRPHLERSALLHELAFQYYTRYVENGGRTTQIARLEKKIDELLNKDD